MEHWGVVEKWSYPDDGYGRLARTTSCSSGAMLMDAGWPREALLVTVVAREERQRPRGADGEEPTRASSSSITRNEAVLLWSETSYRFVKRQIAERSQCFGCRSAIRAPTARDGVGRRR